MFILCFPGAADSLPRIRLAANAATLKIVELQGPRGNDASCLLFVSRET
jgi:hypothetical protein